MAIIEYAELSLLLLCVAIAGFIAYRRFSSAPAVADDIYPFWEEDTEQPPQSGLKAQLATLNLDIRPVVLIATLSAICACVWLSILELFPQRPWLAVIAAIAVLVVSLFIINDLSLWLRRRFEEHMVDALDLIHAAVLGGLAPRQALQAAAKVSPKSVKKEFNDIVVRLDYGLGVHKAVEPMQRRYNTQGVRLFSQALVAKWHSGSDFGLMIKSVGDLMRDQIKLRKLIVGQLSGARYAAIFTGLLPYLLVPLFLWKQPDWFAPLHQNPNGASYVLGAILLQLFAFLWLRRLLRTEI